MARPFGPRVQKICTMCAERPRSFIDIEATLPEAERAGLAQLLCRMADSGLLRRVKLLARVDGGKRRFVYARGAALVTEHRTRARAPRPMPELVAERAAPRVSMPIFEMLCKVFRMGAPAHAPAASMVRTVRGIEHTRPNRDVAQHALPVARFTIPVSEWTVVR